MNNKDQALRILHEIADRKISHADENLIGDPKELKVLVSRVFEIEKQHLFDEDRSNALEKLTVIVESFIDTTTSEK